MTEKITPTFNVDIHMAGDINAAGLAIQRYAADTGMCVTLTPQSFIYTGGREEGFKVGFINYPRFPKEPSEIVARATDLARVLRVQLGQQSYSIVTPVETIWVSHRPEDTPSPQVRVEGSSDKSQPETLLRDVLHHLLTTAFLTIEAMGEDGGEHSSIYADIKHTLEFWDA